MAGVENELREPQSMRTILPGVARPTAMEAHARGGGYQQILATPFGTVTGIATFRVVSVGHVACGWDHPSWPDEIEDRLARHKTTCELRVAGEDSCEHEWSRVYRTGDTCSLGCGAVRL